MNKHISKFTSFQLNEALGVATATTYYTNRLTYVVFDEFYKVIDQMRLEKISSGEISKDIRLGYSDINRLVPKSERDNLYTNFPLSEINITLGVIKKEKKDLDGIMVGGSASSFAKGREKYATRIKPSLRQNLDHTISIHFSIEIIYSDSYKKANMNFSMFDSTYLFKKIESVISHELNHLYEFYMRRLSRSSNINLGITHAILKDNIYNVTENIYNFWYNNFAMLVYCSEPHEINAQTQEAKIWTDKTSFEKFRNNKIWTDAKKMQSWSSKEFLSELGEKFNTDRVELSNMDKMRIIFIKEYSDFTKDWKENPAIGPEKLKKMSNDEFYSFFEKVINKAGSKLVRNFCRLYALK